MTNLRADMVQRIVNSEARRNAKGHIVVYNLKADDGGGTWEVAGINTRYHLVKAKELRIMVERGEHVAAERLAHEYIAEYTDGSALISRNSGLSYSIRDCAWNRGPSGAVQILQLALEVEADGLFGPLSNAALVEAERDVVELLNNCRLSREHYERLKGRNETSDYWEGLTARWDRVLREAIAYHEGSWEPVPSI